MMPMEINFLFTSKTTLSSPAVDSRTNPPRAGRHCTAAIGAARSP
jgi:hypothetical protein